jgi:branched-chain amino acid transport system permease protein
MLVRLLDVLIAGLVMGGIYALAAMGLNLQYGVVRVLNMAHGDFIMLGGFGAFWLFSLLRVSPLLSLLICAPLMFVLGLLVHRLIFHPIRLKSPSISAFEGYSILASYGLIFILQNLVIVSWGGRLKAYSYLASPVNIFGAIFAANRLVALLVTAGISIGFYVFLSRTRMGKAIRAIAQDTEVAHLMSIDVDRLYAITFGLGAALAGLAGVLLSTMFPVSATMGSAYTLIAVVVIVLGGLGNILGGLIGGLALGVVGAVVTDLQPGLVMVAFYVMFLGILLIKPTGIFGKKGG